MTDAIEIPGVSKSESTLLVLFIPSVDRNMQPIDQEKWEKAALEVLGACYGGATAFPKGRGVWRDEQQGGRLIYDETIVIHSYTNINAVEHSVKTLHEFLVRLGQEANQGAVGFVIDRTYMEIRFPLSQGEVGRG
jgi:hypothetical protein